MFFLFGLRLFGSTDSVSFGSGENKKPLFHVATQFFHINFVPLCPFTSFLVLDFLPGRQTRAVKIPTSCKSIGIAWLRFFSWLSVVFFAGVVIIGVASLSDPDPDPFAWWHLPCLLLAAGFASFVTWHDYFNDASHDRAMELLTNSNMNLGERFDATLRRLVDQSFSSQCNIGEGEFEALARTMPSATAELVDGGRREASHSQIANDLELSETTAVPVGGDPSHSPFDPKHYSPFVPDAVVVAQPVEQSMTGSTKTDLTFENENESQFSIV